MPLTTAQQTIFDAPERFRVISAGRRFGKTFLSMYEIARIAKEPNKRIMYICPTYRMAKQILWQDLKEKLISINWAKKINESDLTIVLKNDSRISLRSAQNPDNLKGVSLDLVVMDECAFIQHKTWTEVLRPALADREGSAVFISTPKGSNWFKDIFDDAHNLDDWKSFSYTTVEGGNVTESEVNSAKREMDSRTFKQEFEASFENFAGVIYYNFNHETNIKHTETEILPTTLIHAAIDFNVSPISCALATIEKDNHIHFFDEIVIHGSNTFELVEEINNRYPNNRIYGYPDASGQARKTSSKSSDHHILRQGGIVLKVARSNPPVRDRIAAVNLALNNSDNEVKLTIDPKCKEVIKSLSKQTYKEGTRVPDKDSGTDHMSDAIGYLVNWTSPILAPTREKTGPSIYAHL
jgi:hypothetical protein